MQRNSSDQPLTYRQYGADFGRLVVYFHGTPGAPEECAVFDQAARDNKLTFICYERFAIDPMLEGDAYYQRLADAITSQAGGIPVDMVGFSIGGFIALQVCRLMGTGVRHLHLVSAAAPLEVGQFLDVAAGKRIFRLAQARPSLFLQLVRLQGQTTRIAPAMVFRAMFASATGGDKILAANGKFQADIICLLQSSFVSHVQGYTRDITAYVRPWKDILPGMHVNTHIWHGTEDNWSPVAMAQYLQAAIPGWVATELFDGLSHYSCLYRAVPEICRQLGTSLDTAQAPTRGERKM